MPSLIRLLASLLATALLAACSTTLEKPQRLAALAAPPTGLQVLWATPKPPALSSLPAVGVAAMGTPTSQFFANLPTESIALADALGRSLDATPALQGQLAFAALPQPGSPAQLAAAVKAADRSRAVLVLSPEQVRSHCLPGCYAFKIRLNYLAPGSHARVWTALLDTPPKAHHGDSFDPIAADMARLVVQQLGSEQLLPR